MGANMGEPGRRSEQRCRFGGEVWRKLPSSRTLGPLMPEVSAAAAAEEAALLSPPPTLESVRRAAVGSLLEDGPGLMRRRPSCPLARPRMSGVLPALK